MSGPSLNHKVILRLVASERGYVAELECRGAVRQLPAAATGSVIDNAHAGLRAALSALKTPCYVECFLDPGLSLALEGAEEDLTHPHRVQPYFLSTRDDPRLMQLKNILP